MKRDLTSGYKVEFIAAMTNLKEWKVISPMLHKALYLTSDQPPRFYGLPMVHKATMPLQPIVSSIAMISYKVAQYLAQVLSPLVGKMKHHVKSMIEMYMK